MQKSAAGNVLEGCGQWVGSDLRGLFLGNKLGSLLPRGESVLGLQTTDNLLFGFQTLSKQGFSNAPILSGSTIVGTIGMQDFVHSIVEMHDGMSDGDWNQFLNCSEELREATVGDTMIGPQELPMSEDFCIFFALERFLYTKGKHEMIGVHRINEPDTIRSIVTQSMLIALLWRHEHLWEGFGDTLVKDMELQAAVRIEQTDAAMTGFRRLAANEVDCLAVVNAEGVLVDHLSVSDIRGACSDLARLCLSVSQFKESCKQQFKPAQTMEREFTGGVYLQDSASLKEAISVMVDLNLNQLWICECSGEGSSGASPRPMWVLSQRDVLRVLHNRILKVQVRDPLEECERLMQTFGPFGYGTYSSPEQSYEAAGLRSGAQAPGGSAVSPPMSLSLGVQGAHVPGSQAGRPAGLSASAPTRLTRGKVIRRIPIE